MVNPKAVSSLIVALGILVASPGAWAQGLTPPLLEHPALEASGPSSFTDGRWEFTLEGRLGFPTGHLQVRDQPSPSTPLSLHDLGIHVSGALEGSGAFSFTPQDAVRVSYLHYFLQGSSTQTRSVGYNGSVFDPGSLITNADFYRVGFDYERTFLRSPAGERLVGSAGITWAVVAPTLTGGGQTNTENFGGMSPRTQIPMPIVGMRWDHPVAPNLLLRTSFSAGGLPRVSSLRQEGAPVSTLFLEEANADLGAGLVYLIRPGAQVEGGYHFTYFRIRETNREDLNFFELIDNGLYGRFTLRF